MKNIELIRLVRIENTRFFAGDVLTVGAGVSDVNAQWLLKNGYAKAVEEDNPIPHPASPLSSQQRGEELKPVADLTAKADEVGTPDTADKKLKQAKKG